MRPAECPKCHSRDILVDEDGVGICRSCGYTDYEEVFHAGDKEFFEERDNDFFGEDDYL